MSSDSSESGIVRVSNGAIRPRPSSIAQLVQDFQFGGG